MGATMIYSIPGFHRPGASLCAPVGGTAAVVDKLGGCLEKFGGSMELKKHVEEIIVEDGEATGVVLKGGRIVRAKHAVVSNATVWDTVPLLPNREELTLQGLEGAADWKEDMAEIPALGSIMHLFLGIDATGLPDLDPSHLAVNDWNRPLGDPQNVVTIFIPTVLDPEVAPPGKHIVHVYTAGSEPFDLWEGKDRNSQVRSSLHLRTSTGNWKTDVSCFSFHRSTKITNASGRRSFGTQSKGSFPTSNNAWRLRSTPRR